MKLPRLLSLPIFLLAAAPLSLRAQTEAVTGPPSISVSGTAEVKVAPDLVDIRLSVDVLNTVLETAHTLNEQKTAAVLKLLKELGVDEKDLQTDFVSIEPVYDRGNESQAKPDRFRVQRNISCTLRDVKLLSPVLRGVLGQGVTQVYGLSFRSSELRKHRDQARVEAVQAAKEKAALLAGVLGGKTGRALKISESSPASPRPYNAMFNRVSETSSGASDGAVAAGQISISATVDVTFALE
jgi:hypothetical protein